MKFLASKHGRGTIRMSAVGKGSSNIRSSKRYKFTNNKYILANRQRVSKVMEILSDYTPTEFRYFDNPNKDFKLSIDPKTIKIPIEYLTPLPKHYPSEFPEFLPYVTECNKEETSYLTPRVAMKLARLKWMEAIQKKLAVKEHVFNLEFDIDTLLSKPEASFKTVTSDRFTNDDISDAMNATLVESSSDTDISDSWEFVM